MLVPSAVESRRFGLRIARLVLHPGEEPATSLAGLAEYDLAVAVIPTDVVGHPRELASAWADVEVMEVRVTWEGPARPGHAGLTALSEWGPEHEELVREVFEGYRNHMSRGLGGEHDQVAAGYAEWAQAHVGRDDAALLVWGEPEPTGFAAISVHDDGTTVVIDLAGVAARARGRGVYAGVLDGVEAWATARGSTRVRISTQSDNIPPQRAWSRRGWLPIRTDWIVHLRPRHDAR